MSLPTGYKYFNNMALYIFKSLKQAYIDDYGEDLECHFDRADKKIYQERIFCLDCPTFEACRGRFWNGCPNRAMALKIIKGGRL